MQKRHAYKVGAWEPRLSFGAQLAQGQGRRGTETTKKLAKNEEMTIRFHCRMVGTDFRTIFNGPRPRATGQCSVCELVAKKTVLFLSEVRRPQDHRISLVYHTHFALLQFAHGRYQNGTAEDVQQLMYERRRKTLDHMGDE